MSGRVIVVGSVNIDLVGRVPHLPKPGETVTGGSYDRHHGGKGGNQAVAAARLRRPTLFIGAVGDDSFEKEARRALSSERVDVSMLASLPNQATGVAMILVDATGENQIAVVPGANGAIEPGYVRDCLARLGPLVGDVLLVCNEVSLHVVREALICAHAAGATTVLNPAPATGIDRSTFGLADIVTPNRTELATLLQIETVGTGTKIDDSDADTAKRARALLEAGPSGPGVRRAVIVTLGASGVVVLERTAAPVPTIGRRPINTAAASGADVALAEGVVLAAGALAGGAVAGGAATEGVAAAGVAAAEGTAQVATDAANGSSPCDDPMDSVRDPGRATAEAAPTGRLKPSDLRIWEVPADRVATIDSTGGGDAFCGALAASLAEGRPLAEAVRRAVAAAALATTHVGAREGMPTATELEEFLAARQTA
jgi:ribokinase